MPKEDFINQAKFPWFERAVALYGYRYDQLNRIVAMNNYNGASATNNTVINPMSALPDYNERISYDANGNILTYKRNGTTQGAGSLSIDNLGYQYYSNTNQLKHVSDDPSNSGNYNEDIDNQEYADTTSMMLLEI